MYTGLLIVFLKNKLSQTTTQFFNGLKAQSKKATKNCAYKSMFLFFQHLKLDNDRRTVVTSFLKKFLPLLFAVK